MMNDLENRLLDLIHRESPEAGGLKIDGLRRAAMGSAGASRENWFFDLILENGSGTTRKPCILRRDPPTSLLESGLTTDRPTEYKLLKHLEAFPVRAPKAYWLDAEGALLERPAIIMERMEGHATPTSTFPSYESTAVRDALAPQFVQLLSALHSIDWRTAGFPSFLPVPSDARDAALRQTRLWETVYLKDRSEPFPLVDLAFAWLKAHAPESGTITLVHGDYRSGNYLYDDGGRLHAVLDWELAHLGDPMEDVAWASLRFWANCSGWASGLMPVEDFFMSYRAAAGREIERAAIRYYQVLGNVKMIAICLSGVRVFCDGKRPSSQLAVLGFLIPRLEEDLLRLLSAVS